ncbi:MAG TPA: ROK family protein [Galbitalea sp.]
MNRGSVLGVDVGGTTVKARFVDPAGAVLGEWRVRTPTGDASGKHTSDVIADLVARAAKIDVVNALGAVVPGIVDEEAGVCLRAVNLDWADLPLRRLISERVGVPLAFGQDVRAGALAEGVTGAAAGYPDTFAFVPVGTGLASAVGHGGTVASRTEWPGEIGQELIADGPYAGRRVEEIASASGIALAAGAPDARTVAELVRAGDERAIRVWENAIEVLAGSLAGIVTDTGASLLVIGGGLAEAGSLLLRPLDLALRALLPSTRVELRRASHGDSAAVIGAILLAQRLIATP